MGAWIWMIFSILGASVVATIALSAIRVWVLSKGDSSAADLISSVLLAVAVVTIVVAAAALTLRAAIATPLSRLAESLEQGAAPHTKPRLQDASRLEAGVRKLLAETRAQEREAAAERERQLRGELADARQSCAQTEARLAGLAAISERLTRLARGDLTGRISDAPGAHPLASRLDQAVSLVAKTVLAFSASLDAIRDGAEQMNASADAYGEQVSRLAATMEAALGAFAKRSESAAQLEAPLAASARLVRALVEDVARQGEAVRRGCGAFGEIGETAKQIAPILTLVDEVAFQTNMLALNAGVEAARVGDAGRGMGVVAQELRLLAQRAAKAAKDSGVLVTRVLAQAERGAGELSSLEAAHAALPERAAKILGPLEQAALKLAEAKSPREAARASMDPFTEAAFARARLREQMTDETEALESLIGKLSALTGRFKFDANDEFAFRPPPRNSQPVRKLPPPASPHRARGS